MDICVLKDTWYATSRNPLCIIHISDVLSFIFPMSYIYAYVCRMYIYMCIGASFPKNTFASWRICVLCRVSESTMYYPYLRCSTHIYTLVGYIYTCIGASFHETRLRLERYMWCAGVQNPLCIIHNSDVLHIYVYVGYIYTCIGASFHDTRLRLKGYVLYATRIQAWRTRGVYKTYQEMSCIQYISFKSSWHVLYTTYVSAYICNTYQQHIWYSTTLMIFNNT